MAIVLDGTANTVTPLNGALGGTTPSTVVATSVNTPNTFGFKNRIINGAMQIDQRNAGASVTPTSSGYRTVDRFYVQLTQSSKFSIQQQTSVVPDGFTNSVKITSLAATSLAAGDYYTFQQLIEGLNCADLAWGTANAKTVTLSFQVYSSLTGTFGGSLTNEAFNRSYAFTYSIPVANTWTTISVTIAGDTTGTWLKNNGIGIQVIFGLGVGTTYSGTAGSWGATGLLSATGATSVVGTSGATFYITGVQLEKGSTATSFDVRDYGRELSMCQRYYFMQRGNGGASFVSVGGMAYSTTAGGFTVVHPVTMRSIPSSVDFSNLAATVPSTSTSSAFTGIAIATGTGESTAQITQLNATGTSGLTQFRPYFLTTNVSSGYLGLNAEL